MLTFCKVGIYVLIMYFFTLVSAAFCNFLIFKRRKSRKKFNIVAWQLAQQNRKNK